MAKNGYRAAIGCTVKKIDCQEMVVALRTDEGNHGSVNYQDADVEIPILSVGKLCDTQNMTECHDTWGASTMSPPGRNPDSKGCTGPTLSGYMPTRNYCPGMLAGRASSFPGVSRKSALHCPTCCGRAGDD